MFIPIRKSIKLVLLNEKNELLLICVDDPQTTTVDGIYHGRFWDLIGGKIEEGESLEKAATRELHEETGITKEDVVFGPVVWFGQFEIILAGTRTFIKQRFMVVRTKKKEVVLHDPTEYEKQVVKKLRWFSLENIQKSPEVIFPIVLPEYLPDVLSEKYPEQPIEINLKTEPKK